MVDFYHFLSVELAPKKLATKYVCFMSYILLTEVVRITK